MVNPPVRSPPCQRHPSVAYSAIAASTRRRPRAAIPTASRATLPVCRRPPALRGTAAQRPFHIPNFVVLVARPIPSARTRPAVDRTTAIPAPCRPPHLAPGGLRGQRMVDQTPSLAHEQDPVAKGSPAFGGELISRRGAPPSLTHSEGAGPQSQARVASGRPSRCRRLPARRRSDSGAR